jgi:hypothetical protein
VEAMVMDRQEAAGVLREILGECDESLLLSCISLSPIASNKKRVLLSNCESTAGLMII